LASTVFAAWPHEDISQAVFAKSVKDRAPIDIITEADNSLGKIYFFPSIYATSFYLTIHASDYP
jgi:hypothetical protein